MSCHRTIIRLSAVLAVVALSKGCGDGENPAAPPTPEPARPTTVTVSPATRELTALGTTVQLSAEVRDRNARVMAGATVTWTSSASSMATVDASGLVTAAGNGTATITASAGSASGSAVVTVMQSVASVEVSPSVYELTALGQTVQLTAEAFDENGHAVAGAEFSWESSDAAVATVDAGGLVTAVAEGVATITASAGEASGSAVVTVMQPVASVEVSPSVETITAVGNTLQLVAEAFDGNGYAVAGAEFSWESSDAAIATVDGMGLVTAVGNGEATITATSGTASGSAAVTVAAARSAPPTWVFAGNIPESNRMVFRREMEYSRAYFANEYGVEATGFTVLVGENHEALARVYKDATGSDLPDNPFADTDAWVTSSVRGGAVITLLYGFETWTIAKLTNYIVHEYFHVLQGQLASGLEPVGNGEIGWSLGNNFPRWLGEGQASYADYRYSPTRPGRAPFLGDRYSPFEDLGIAASTGRLDLSDLAKDLTPVGICAWNGFEFYALSFVATFFLMSQAPDDAYIEFWKLLSTRSTWEEAFKEAFGIDINDFNRDFEEWLPSQITSYDQLVMRILWPEKSTDPQIPGEQIPMDIEASSSFKLLLRTSVTLPSVIRPPIDVRITAPAGTVGTAVLSLWWYNDPRTEYLLGWYKDGELTDQRAEAPPLRFTGISWNDEWTLPAHPSTLPRLSCRVWETTTACP